MPKQKRHHDALADTVNVITFDEDDELVETEYKDDRRGHQWTEAKAQIRHMWDLLSYQGQDLFNSSSHGTLFSDIPVYNPDAPDDDEWNDDDFQVPVGDEGSFNSNAGGEFGYHTLLNTLLEEAPRHVDMRQRHHRTEDQNQSWQRQLPRLVDAYLRYQSEGSPDRDEECEGEPWTIVLMEFYEHRDSDPLRHVRGSLTANKTLARYGLLGGSPDDPNIAFSF
ncbi:hypothetical protein PQX77_011913 [Marasmius sp. AFHP31]|nr:hypothetical protein PQX77_011913 [Marasmius sp. AFHP31]